jgi:hemerythrin
MELQTAHKSYSVGVQTLDKQKTVLFEILNDLHFAMMCSPGQSSTGPLLRSLVESTHNHFSAEEAMLMAANFAGLADHRSKHRALIEQVEEFAAGYDSEELALNLHLLNFLRDWFTIHIQTADPEYVPWLKRHGVN